MKLVQLSSSNTLLALELAFYALVPYFSEVHPLIHPLIVGSSVPLFYSVPKHETQCTSAHPRMGYPNSNWIRLTSTSMHRDDITIQVVFFGEKEYPDDDPKDQVTLDLEE